jgi:hypothetical protein
MVRKRQERLFPNVQEIRVCGVGNVIKNQYTADGQVRDDILQVIKGTYR